MVKSCKGGEIVSTVLKVFLIIFSYRLLRNITHLITLSYLSSKYENWTKGEGEFLIIHGPLLRKKLISLGYSPLYIDIEDTEYTLKKCENALYDLFIKIMENFNPFFWIDIVINLPKNILTYLGVQPDKIIVKLLQLIWWSFVPIALILREKLWTSLSAFIQSF